MKNLLLAHRITTAICIALVLFLSYMLLNVSMQMQCDPPPRPPNIPGEARWNGFCDGGAWEFIKEIKGDTITLVKYGHDGKYIIDEGDFFLKNCNVDLSLFGKDFIYKNLRYFFDGLVNINDTIVFVRVKKDSNNEK